MSVTVIAYVHFSGGLISHGLAVAVSGVLYLLLGCISPKFRIVSVIIVMGMSLLLYVPAGFIVRNVAPFSLIVDLVAIAVASVVSVCFLAKKRHHG
jgi:hypothetical protein